jgi:hypothetical protein
MSQLTSPPDPVSSSYGDRAKQIPTQIATAPAEDDRFTISFDGNELFSTTDSTFVGPGKVALWTKADSVTYFDTISITPLG